MSWLKYPWVSKHAGRYFLSWAAGCCPYRIISKPKLTIWLLLPRLKTDQKDRHDKLLSYFGCKFMPRTKSDLAVCFHVFKDLHHSSCPLCKPFHLFMERSHSSLLTPPPPPPAAAITFWCRLQPGLKVRKVGVWAANHWFKLFRPSGTNIRARKREIHVQNVSPKNSSSVNTLKKHEAHHRLWKTVKHPAHFDHLYIYNVLVLRPSSGQIYIYIYTNTSSTSRHPFT